MASSDRILRSEDDPDDAVSSSSCGCFFGFGSRLTRSSSIRSRYLPLQQDEEEEESWMMKKVRKIRWILKSVAGRKWRSFVNGIISKRRSLQFQYDPRSYALNFDEGIGKEGGGNVNLECRARSASSISF